MPLTIIIVEKQSARKVEYHNANGRNNVVTLPVVEFRLPTLELQTTFKYIADHYVDNNTV